MQRRELLGCGGLVGVGLLECFGQLVLEVARLLELTVEARLEALLALEHGGLVAGRGLGGLAGGDDLLLEPEQLLLELGDLRLLLAVLVLGVEDGALV